MTDDELKQVEESLCAIDCQTSDSERLKAAMLALIAEVQRLRARPCPYVVQAGEGTVYCGLPHEDTARLDWLEAQCDGNGWTARKSAHGRGYRLHNPGAYATARDAIDKAREEERNAQEGR